jgi:hypothetical protein
MAKTKVNPYKATNLDKKVKNWSKILLILITPYIIFSNIIIFLKNVPWVFNE